MADIVSSQIIVQRADIGMQLRGRQIKRRTADQRAIDVPAEGVETQRGDGQHATALRQANEIAVVLRHVAQALTPLS